MLFFKGFMIPQGTVRNGARCSTSKAFLRPIRFRKNLHIAKYAFVMKVSHQSGCNYFIFTRLIFASFKFVFVSSRLIAIDCLIDQMIKCSILVLVTWAKTIATDRLSDRLYAVVLFLAHLSSHHVLLFIGDLSRSFYFIISYADDAALIILFPEMFEFHMRVWRGLGGGVFAVILVFFLLL